MTPTRSSPSASAAESRLTPAPKATKLQRTANRMNALERPPMYRKWTPDEVEVVRAAYIAGGDGNVGLRSLAMSLNRSEGSVSRRARKLGLTRHGRPKPAGARQLIGAMASARIAASGHPRGMLGKHHSDAAREKMHLAAARNLANGTHPGLRARSVDTLKKMSVAATRQLTSAANIWSRCHRGRRADIGPMFFRSAWEANYARYLNLLLRQGRIVGWAYEPETFWFEAVRRGSRSYTPDFRVDRGGGAQPYYVEVKGWMDARSKTKIKRMAKYHPTVELRVVTERSYQDIANKLGPAIPGWEW